MDGLGRPPSSEPHTGFWGTPTSSIQWCETNYEKTSYIAEFWNTISNFPFIIVGSIAWYHAAKEKFEARYILLSLGVIIVGLGSIAFHATLQHSTQQADETPMVWSGLMWIYVGYSDWVSRQLKLQKQTLAAVLMCYGVGFSILHWYARFVVFFHYHFGAICVLLILNVYCCYRVLRHVSILPIKEPRNGSILEDEEYVPLQTKQRPGLVRRIENEFVSGKRGDKDISGISNADSPPKIEGTVATLFFINTKHLLAPPHSVKEAESVKQTLWIAGLYIHTLVIGVACWMADFHLCHYLESDVRTYYASDNYVLPINPQAHAWWHIATAMNFYSGILLVMFVRARQLGRQPVLSWKFGGIVPVVSATVDPSALVSSCRKVSC